MKFKEREYLKSEIRVNVMPELKKQIPTVLGWVLRLVFPKMEKVLIEMIERIVDNILKDRDAKH